MRPPASSATLRRGHASCCFIGARSIGYGPGTRAGLSIVPLKIYFKGGRAKVEIGLAKGKKMYDKRDDIARKSPGVTWNAP